MAKMTRGEVLKLANLAKLELSNKEIEQFTKEIGDILTYVDQLKSVDVDNLEPTYQVTGLEHVTRPDKPLRYGANQSALLKNAPHKLDNQIKVRRVL